MPLSLSWVVPSSTVPAIVVCHFDASQSAIGGGDKRSEL